MKKLFAIVSSIVFGAALLIPPWDLSVNCIFDPGLFFFMTFICGTITFLFLYSKLPVSLKLLTIYLYINSFLSHSPFISFVGFSFVTLAGLFYLMILHSEKDYILNTAQAIFLLMALLFFMQLISKDALLNSKQAIWVFGTVGNKMVFGQLFVVLTALACLANPISIIPAVMVACFLSSFGSIGALVSIGTGLITYSVLKMKSVHSIILALVIIALMGVGADKCNVWGKFLNARGPVWAKTIEQTKQHPFVGWGLSTYKIIFPPSSQGLVSSIGGVPWEIDGINGSWTIEQVNYKNGVMDIIFNDETKSGKSLLWTKAHSCWLQFLWETGLIGFALLLCFAFGRVKEFICSKKTDSQVIAFSGLMALAVNMMINFPTRFAQSSVAMIVFLGIYQLIMKKSEAIADVV